MASAVAIVTCKRCINEQDNVFLARALRAAGVRAEICVWDDASVPWRDFACAVVRTPWDYHTQRERFLAWAAQTPIPLFNDSKMLRWNTDKRYLSELSALGVPIVPTEFVGNAQQSSPPKLSDIAAQRGWKDVVVKPCVSASADRTSLVSAAQLSQKQTQADFEALVADCGDVMVQPFVQSIRTAGELSLIFIGGRFTHSARKRPAAAADSFCVQEHLGGSTVLEPNPPEGAMRLAERVLAAQFEVLHEKPLYARVDMFYNDDDAAKEPFLLSELEITEPSLYHNLCPHSAELFAAELATIATAARVD